MPRPRRARGRPAAVGSLLDAVARLAAVGSRCSATCDVGGADRTRPGSRAQVAAGRPAWRDGWPARSSDWSRVAEQLVPDGEVRREARRSPPRGRRRRGQQDHPAGQRPPVARTEPAVAVRTSRQHVPHTAHGVDQPRLALGLGLAAQVADVDLERVGGRGEVVAPDLLEDEGPVEHPARPAQEHLQQRELGAGQLDRAVAAAHLAGGRVQGQVGERQHLVSSVRSSAGATRRSSARSRASSSSSANGLVR